jgi:fructose-1,6-bisphosphatase I/sedoheptulose-1,7-bisphosphatase/fructose-1,6-bisphosphatase I
MTGRTTLAKFIVDEAHRPAGATPDLGALVLDLASGLKAISALLSRGVLADALGDAATRHSQDEGHRKLGVLANQILLDACERGGTLIAIASEEMEQPYSIPREYRRGSYLLAFDPLDGSSNLDVNLGVGTIFSISRRPEAQDGIDRGEFLQPGSRQLCAGYALYGPSTMLVLTLGRGVHAFTLDPSANEFVLSHADLRIPKETREFAVNACNERFWEPPVRRYVEECLAGQTGPRGLDFNMRWTASLIAEVHRILIRGGLFIYPRDTKDAARQRGRFRLLYEAAPMAMIVEQAGGLASTGRARLLEVVPRELHERVPLILGSRREVERLVRYHLDHDRGLGRPYTDPLFKVRSLLREP